MCRGVQVSWSLPMEDEMVSLGSEIFSQNLSSECDGNLPEPNLQPLPSMAMSPGPHPYNNDALQCGESTKGHRRQTEASPHWSGDGSTWGERRPCGQVRVCMDGPRLRNFLLNLRLPYGHRLGILSLASGVSP